VPASVWFSRRLNQTTTEQPPGARAGAAESNSSICPRKEGLIMLYIHAYAEDHVREVINDRLREAEQLRLADLAHRPGRPVRARVAAWLIAVARRIEGQPRPATLGAEA
jgi:hypothetical protein